MEEALYNLGYFIQSLSLYDFLFLLSVIVLIIMLTSLVYIFKISQSNDDFDDKDDNDKNNENKKEEEKDNINEEQLEDNELDLLKISKEIDENKSPIISLNDYEKEQEEKAIISYDELIAASKEKDQQINYKNEENINGLTIKAVDLEMFNTRPIELPRKKNEIIPLEEKVVENEDIVEKDDSPPVLISYEKEEAFLQTLKQLQELLN